MNEDLSTWTVEPDADGWQTPPPSTTHHDAVNQFLAGVVALRAEMGDLLPDTVIAYARDLHHAAKNLTDDQRDEATKQMRAIYDNAGGYSPRALLIAAIVVQQARC